MLPLVFCVDDDSMVHMLSEIILQETKFCSHILCFENGKLALDYLHQQINLPEEERKIPALIFLDINMPVVDGWDFLDYFSSELSSLIHLTKIIILSSSVDPSDEKRAKQNTLVFEFLHKPLGFEEVGKLKQNNAFKSYFLQEN